MKISTRHLAFPCFLIICQAAIHTPPLRADDGVSKLAHSGGAVPRGHYKLTEPPSVDCDKALLNPNINMVVPEERIRLHSCIPPLGEDALDIYLVLISPSGKRYSITAHGKMISGVHPYYRGVSPSSECQCKTIRFQIAGERMRLGRWTAVLAVLPAGAEAFWKNALTYDIATITVVKTPRVPIKVLTVVAFGYDAARGEAWGEAQHWVENEQMDRKIEIQGAYAPLYCNDQGHCLIITGMGIANASASLMALGLSSKLDVRKTYFITAGVAGVTPEVGTLGTAAWIEWIVNGDTCHEIDFREMPEEWDFPRFHLGCEEPWCKGRVTGNEVFHLNPRLVEWAYRISQHVKLIDSEKAQQYRGNYPPGLPARRKPFVTKCDCIAGSTYWVGALSSAWADWWVNKWTGGAGTYCMTSMEDSGIVGALMRLGREGLVDPDRILVLRTASDFDQQYPGQSAIDCLAHALSEDNPGYPLAIENAYRVGSTFSRHIISHWDEWEKGTPALE